MGYFLLFRWTSLICDLVLPCLLLSTLYVYPLHLPLCSVSAAAILSQLNTCVASLNSLVCMGRARAWASASHRHWISLFFYLSEAFDLLFAVRMSMDFLTTITKNPSKNNSPAQSLKAALVTHLKNHPSFVFRRVSTITRVRGVRSSLCVDDCLQVSPQQICARGRREEAVHDCEE